MKGGMEVYAWCVPSHTFSIQINDRKKPGLIGGFKSYTSRSNHFNEKNQQSWWVGRGQLTPLIQNQFSSNITNRLNYGPEKRFSAKVDYTNNPVETAVKGNDYEYLYSSARDYCGIRGLVKVIIDD